MPRARREQRPPVLKLDFAKAIGMPITELAARLVPSAHEPRGGSSPLIRIAKSGAPGEQSVRKRLLDDRFDFSREAMPDDRLSEIEERRIRHERQCESVRRSTTIEPLERVCFCGLLPAITSRPLPPTPKATQTQRHLHPQRSQGPSGSNLLPPMRRRPTPPRPLGRRPPVAPQPWRQRRTTQPRAGTPIVQRQTRRKPPNLNRGRGLGSAKRDGDPRMQRREKRWDRRGRRTLWVAC